jgi:ATP-dependent Clp protease ATP-binding subunit ClpB
VRRRPYSVVLFDEIEKAHPDVFNILLQILDDGRLTDSQGRTVDFRNSVIIMTSNIGSPYILEHAGTSDWEAVEKTVLAELQRHFRPEFLNRVDDIIVFRPLNKEQIRHIVELQLGRLRRLLAERRIQLEITPAAADLIASVGFDQAFGARPLKRAIQRLVQNPLAVKLLEGEFADGDTIIADRGRDGDQIAFRRAEHAAAVA